jgi:MoxR-like ATPase
LNVTAKNKLKELETMDKIAKLETLIKAQSGITYLMGEPGKGKTAILKSIAKKNGWNYFDLRISQMDEAEVAGYPYHEKIDGVELAKYAMPEWAIEANKVPTLVVFEELNRAPLRVRNAALQILNERQIRESFFFNENVYMAATGNTGEDGCEVEEFDTALWNRIILFKYDLSIEEWENYYAKEHVKKEIVAFVKAFPEHFYKQPTEKERVFPSPRSWTFLSNMLIKTCGKNANINEILPYVTELAHMYVGPSAQRFIRYLKDTVSVTIDDIIERYDQLKEEVAKMSRDKISELLVNLKEKKILGLPKEQLKNVKDFLQVCDEDEVVGFLNEYILRNPELDPTMATKDANMMDFFKTFQKYFAKMSDIDTKAVKAKRAQSN